MITVLRLPKLGLTMDEATVVRWLVSPEAAVVVGQPLLEVETDKATLEVESPVGGYLRQQAVGPGDQVALGQALGVLSTSADESLPTADERRAAAPSDKVESSPHAARSMPESPVQMGVDRPTARASPAVRKRAAELGLDLSQIQGSGPGGRVRESDLEGALSSPAAQAAVTPGNGSWKISSLSRGQRATAQRMVQSAREIPQFSLRSEVSAGPLLAARRKLLERIPAVVTRVSITDFLMQAVAAALMAHPSLRSRLVGDLKDGRIAICPSASVGLAVDTPSGLLVPVLAGLEHLTIDEIAGLRQEAVAGARQGRLASRFTSESTFTISNLGPYQVDEFTALVTPGDAGVLAVGGITQAVGITEPEGPQIYPVLRLTFSFDHRLVDGVEGARFAAHVVDHLAAPVVVAP